LQRSLIQVQAAVRSGERDAAKLIEIGKQVIGGEPGARLDYYAVVSPDTLEPLSDLSQSALVAVAAYVGTTRLIDNVLLS
jgi:pantoate--beta-alanine ligase